jgi:mono/diheme cytochrome c family protein
MNGRRALLASALLAASVNLSFAQDEAATIARGKAVFDRYCVACHGPGRGDDGAPMLPGTHAIFLKYEGAKPPLLTDRTDLPYEALKTIVRNGVASMPPFRKTELTDEDIRAVAAYFAHGD